MVNTQEQQWITLRENEQTLVVDLEVASKELRYSYIPSRYVPALKEMLVLRNTGFKGVVELDLTAAMSKGKITTAKRFIKTGIINHYRGWSAGVAALTFHAAGVPYLMLPTKAYYRSFTIVGNSWADPAYMNAIADEFLSIASLLRTRTVPWKVVKRVGKIEISVDLASVALEDGYSYHRATQEFSQMFPDSQIQTYMVEAIKRAKEQFGVRTPVLPTKLRAEII